MSKKLLNSYSWNCHVFVMKVRKNNFHISFLSMWVDSLHSKKTFIYNCESTTLTWLIEPSRTWSFSLSLCFVILFQSSSHPFGETKVSWFHYFQTKKKLTRFQRKSYDQVSMKFHIKFSSTCKNWTGRCSIITKITNQCKNSIEKRYTHVHMYIQKLNELNFSQSSKMLKSKYFHQ